MKTQIVTSALAIFLTLAAISVSQTKRLTTSDKLNRIRFPCVEFHDANAIDVADYLLDITDPNPPFRTSIILDLNHPGGASEELQETDSRKQFYKDLPSVTITLTNATMLQVVESLTTAASLKYEIQDDRVIIKGPDGRDLKKEKWVNQAFEVIGDPGSP